jgi:hypothetical protein
MTIDVFFVHDTLPFRLSLSKPVLSWIEGPFDRLRANGSEGLVMIHDSPHKVSLPFLL